MWCWCKWGAIHGTKSLLTFKQHPKTTQDFGLFCSSLFCFLWNLITAHPELTKTTCTRSSWHWSCSVDFYFYYCLVVDLHVQANTSSRHSERQQWQLFILFVILHSHNREISGHLAKLYLIKSSSAFDSLATWLPAPSTTYSGKGI